jgi:hypothetical protein
MKAIACFSNALCVLFLFAFACDKQEEKVYTDVLFEFPISVYPVRDTLRVGDTLWIEANNPDTIFEIFTNKRYPLQNIDFRTRFALFRNETPELLSLQPGAIGSFKIVNKIGGIENPQQTFSDYRYKYENNKYIALSGIIPQRRGVYTLNFFSQKEGRDAVETAIQSLFSKQGESVVPLLTRDEIRYPINEGIHTNFHLFKKYGKPGSLIEPNSVNTFFEQRATYTFIVVE